jgi:hypothetical protein
MAKQRPAGANDRDLPWWFDLYHTAWIITFLAVWYYFGTFVMLAYIGIVAVYFSVFG